MQPLWGFGGLVVIVLLSVVVLSSLRCVQSWAHRRELELLVLAAPLLGLGISIASLRAGSGTICFLGPIPISYRVTIALPTVMGGIAVLGVLGGLLRFLLWHATVARRGTQAMPALSTLAEQFAGDLGIRAPRLRLAFFDQPLALTYGVRRPTVLLSSWMLLRLDEQELAAVVAHELGHVARHDYATAWLATVLRDAFFYLPTSWWAYRLLQEEKEPACDDLAVGLTDRPLALASALAKVWQRTTAAHSPALAQALSGVHATIETRITRLLERPTPTAAPAIGHQPALGLGASAFAVLLLLEALNVAVLTAPSWCGGVLPLEKLL